MAMSLSQARVIDPILSNHSRGYTQAGYIGDQLLPIVNMPSRAAKRIEFGREAFRRYQIRRAPGARIAQISVGYEGKTVSLSQYALGATTPMEHVDEAAEVPGIDLLTENVNTVLAVIALEKEIQQATAARNPAIYANSNKIALSGGAKWTDPASSPKKIVSDGKEVVRSKTGRRPNVLTLGPGPAAALKIHPDVKDQYKHVKEPTISDEMLARYFDVEKVLVGDSIVDDNSGAPSDVWGNDAILAYVPAEGQRGMRVPAFGYTYRLHGHPFVTPVAWEKGTRSWENDVFDEWSPEIVGADAGYLIQAAV